MLGDGKARALEAAKKELFSRRKTYSLACQVALQERPELRQW